VLAGEARKKLDVLRERLQGALQKLPEDLDLSELRASAARLERELAQARPQWFHITGDALEIEHLSGRVHNLVSVIPGLVTLFELHARLGSALVDIEGRRGGQPPAAAWLAGHLRRWHARLGEVSMLAHTLEEVQRHERELIDVEWQVEQVAAALEALAAARQSRAEIEQRSGGSVPLELAVEIGRFDTQVDALLSAALPEATWTSQMRALGETFDAALSRAKPDAPAVGRARDLISDSLSWMQQLMLDTSPGQTPLSAESLGELEHRLDRAQESLTPPDPRELLRIEEEARQAHGLVLSTARDIRARAHHELNADLELLVTALREPAPDLREDLDRLFQSLDAPATTIDHGAWMESTRALRRRLNAELTGVANDPRLLDHLDARSKALRDRVAQVRREPTSAGVGAMLADALDALPLKWYLTSASDVRDALRLLSKAEAQIAEALRSSREALRALRADFRRLGERWSLVDGAARRLQTPIPLQPPQLHEEAELLAERELERARAQLEASQGRLDEELRRVQRVARAHLEQLDEEILRFQEALAQARPELAREPLAPAPETCETCEQTLHRLATAERLHEALGAAFHEALQGELAQGARLQSTLAEAASHVMSLDEQEELADFLERLSDSMGEAREGASPDVLLRLTQALRAARMVLENLNRQDAAAERRVKTLQCSLKQLSRDGLKHYVGPLSQPLEGLVLGLKAPPGGQWSQLTPQIGAAERMMERVERSARRRAAAEVDSLMESLDAATARSRDAELKRRAAELLARVRAGGQSQLPSSNLRLELRTLSDMLKHQR
jgi:hypothetical protein